MRILIDNVLAQQSKTRYWLSKESGITYQNIMRLCNNQTDSIKFTILERVCKVLECTPNDIIELNKD